MKTVIPNQNRVSGSELVIDVVSSAHIVQSSEWLAAERHYIISIISEATQRPLFCPAPSSTAFSSRWAKLDSTWKQQIIIKNTSSELRGSTRDGHESDSWPADC